MDFPQAHQMPVGQDSSLLINEKSCTGKVDDDGRLASFQGKAGHSHFIEEWVPDRVESFIAKGSP